MPRVATPPTRSTFGPPAALWRLLLTSLLVMSCAASPPRPSPVVVAAASTPSAVAISAAPETGSLDADLVRLTLVATNDFHGWINGPERGRKVGGVDPVEGGIDMFAGYLRVIRQQRPGEVLLVDAGDLFQGPLVNNLFEGRAVIELYNQLGYDAVAVGNHEFDYGPEGPPVVATGPGQDPLGNLKRRMTEARFPFLAANITDKATGRPVDWPARPSVIIERAGLKVGLIGLSTPTTPEVTLADNVAGLVFEELSQAAVREAASLRARGAQVVILAMHAGGGCRSTDDPHDLSSCDQESELFQLMRQLPAGTVDAVVGGHTHQYVAHFVNGVPTVESGCYGVSFGMIELFYDRRAGRVVPARSRIHKPVPVCRFHDASGQDCRGTLNPPLVAPRFWGVAIKSDAAVAAVARPYLEQVASRQNELLGPTLQEPIGRSRTTQSALGSVVADVMRAAVPGAQVALTNAGGLRSDLVPGPLTYGRVFAALPFDNHLVELHLSGAELLRLLEVGLRKSPGVAQTSGLRMVAVAPQVEPCAGGSPLLEARLDDGSAIDPAATYIVVTNEFVASGGDGFGAVLNAVPAARKRHRHDLPLARELLADWFRSHPAISGPGAIAEGRLRYDEPACAAATGTP